MGLNQMDSGRKPEKRGKGRALRGKRTLGEVLRAGLA